MVALANRKVLVLNRNWQAVGVVSMDRAITLLYSQYKATNDPKALVVDTDDFRTFTWSDWAELKPKEGEKGIISARAVFRVPEVIVLTRYDRLPTHRVTFSRRTIYKRDHYQCQYCGRTPGSEELTIDHIVPRAQGGQTTWTNCVLACLPCNSRKADRTPEEAGMKLRREPFKPKYQLFRGDIPCDSWKKFLSEAYWNVEMENDEPDIEEAPKVTESAPVKNKKSKKSKSKKKARR